MIDPSMDDIGREVVYAPRGVPWADAARESGVITSFNGTCVFVRYGADKHSKGARREDLEWGHDDTL